MQAHWDCTDHGPTHWPSTGGTFRDGPDSRDAQDGGLFGMVRGVSLVDLLQMYHLARCSVVLRCADQSRVGEIHLSHGEIVHAYTAGKAGRAALRRLLGLSEGLVTSEPATGGGAQSIDEPMQPLLLDLMREIDEDARLARDERVPARLPAVPTDAHQIASHCPQTTISADQTILREARDCSSTGCPRNRLRIDHAKLRTLARRMSPEAGSGLTRWIGLAALVVSTIGFMLGLLG